MGEEYRELLIGCGSRRERIIRVAGHDGWTDLTTLDINPDHKPDVVWDLEQLPLPFEDNRFDEIHCYEVLEHLGRQGDYRAFFAQFSEFWRILKPNGALCATVPAAGSPWVWGEPSHSRAIQPESLVFLDQAQYTEQIGKTPMSDFRYLYKADFAPHWSHFSEGPTFCFVLRAVKPSRITLPG